MKPYWGIDGELIKSAETESFIDRKIFFLKKAVVAGATTSFSGWLLVSASGFAFVCSGVSLV